MNRLAVLLRSILSSQVVKNKKDKDNPMSQKNMDQPNAEMAENESLKGTENEKLFDFDKANPDTTEEALDVKSDTSNVASLQSQVSELKDKHLRLLAEFENYKKRTVRERLDLMSTASKDVILALLPILDDFDRAKKSADDPAAGEHFSEGVSLVFNRLNSTLQSLGLKVMESTGQPFDAEFHEAITEIPVPNEDMKGKVIDTIEKGYSLNDKIIRHAKVVVGK
jgi:molecular chaperone GrpE